MFRFRARHFPKRAEIRARDAELCNYGAEHDDADASANPGEEGAHVGEMVARFAGVCGRRGSCHEKAIDCAGPEKQDPAACNLVERLVALQCEHQPRAESVYTLDGGGVGRRIVTRKSKPKDGCRAKSPGATCMPLNLRPI